MSPLRTAGLPFAVLAALLAACATTPPPSRPIPAPEPGMLVVPEGSFTMGDDRGPVNERPAHEVWLAEYRIDRLEVSAADFAGFLNTAGNPEEIYFTPDEHSTVILLPPQPGESRQRFGPRPGFETHPATGVSWQGADLYCRWKDRRLPTEAEWEKAARGTDRRRFPWGGSPPDPSRARFGRDWEDEGLAVLAPAESLPAGASPYGALNMAGNVMEWVSDWYRRNLCDFCSPEQEANLWLVRELTPRDESEPGAAPASGQVPPRRNPAGPSTGSFKVLRGGSWREHDGGDLAVTRRFWFDPAQRFPVTGFRCAASPPAAAAAGSPP